MKKNYSRFFIIAIVTVVILLYVLATKSYASGITDFQHTVTGVVEDENGVPVPGVTIIVQGTNRGTTTNLDGNYLMIVPPEGVLVFSFVGFKKMEVPVEGRSEINVILVRDIASLEEVEINAGYYHTTKRKSTGNISRVTAEEIEMQPVTSPLQALQGRMAGVEILPEGEYPGMAPTIRIRGRNSLREEGNLPLYIIDGVPINATPIESRSYLGLSGIDPLSTLNLNNIQSIEVLKDADATAIYGSRGANGVVLITTKKGEFSDKGIHASVYTGAATMPNRLDLLNTEQYLRLRKQALENDGIEPAVGNAPDLVLWDQARYTDWQDIIFGGTSAIHDLNFSAVGGNDNTIFRIGGSYHSQGTIYPAEFDYEKTTAALNIRHTSDSRKLSLNLSLSYGLDDSDAIGKIDLLSSTFFIPPNAPRLFNEDGSLHWEEWSEAGWSNPFEGFYNRSETKNNNLISNLGVSYEILPGLSIKSTLGYTDYNSDESIEMPKRSYSPESSENIDHQSSHLQNDRKSWIVEPQLTFTEKIGNGIIDALLGGTIQENTYGITGFLASGYVTESLIGSLSAAQTISNSSGEETRYRYAGLYGRLGFSWEEKYFLNVTGRRDGSSRFGPGNRFGNFGAVGAAWIFSDETFIEKNLPFLTFGKLRGSFGTAGNDQIGDYGYFDAYEATPGPGGLYPVQLANAEYSWEVNKKLEAAVDLGFLSDRLMLGVSWYRNRSSNQLVGYVLPFITGFSSVQANLPATVENTGVEVTFSSLNLRTTDFNWETSFNITFPKNELISYPNIDQSSYAFKYKVGYPLNIDLLYDYQGIDPETGLYRVRDVNEDGRFDYSDRVVIQNWGRDFYGGLSNNLTYKNFSLQFLVRFVQQKGKISLFNAGEIGNQRTIVMEALENDSRFQKVSASLEAARAYSRVLNSNRPIVDASYARLESLSLGYQIPTSVVRKVLLTKARVFLNGQNLFTVTDYTGLDPEHPLSGLRFSGLRTITGGIQLQF